ncbi:MAG: hypothetical protein WCB96_08235, partial [Candidatus Aminicenantales bacterium]
MRGTFVLYDVKDLPAPGVHKTPAVPTRHAAALADDLLFTRLVLTRKKAVGGFFYAQLVHRQVLRPEQQGDSHWFHGGHELDEIVTEHRFIAYWHPERSLFVCHADRELARSAITSLNRRLDGFALAPVRLDPQRVRQAHQHGVLLGVWLRRPGQDLIRTQAAFGADVENGPDFAQAVKKGELSSIRLQTMFDRRRLRVNVSRSGSMFFSQDAPLDTCLGFIIHLLAYRSGSN